MTRRQAADYLCISVDTLDKNLVPAAEGNPPAGKMRYRKSGVGASTKIRVWTEDVIALCPPPPGETLNLVEEHA
jgi:hypothetical protein